MNSEPDQNPDRKEIDRLFNSHKDLVLNSNWDALSSHYSEDVVVMFPGQGDIVGRSQLIDWQKSYPPISEYETKICDLEISGDLAYLRGEYSMAISSPGNGETTRDSGRWLWILKRDSSGSWKIIRDIFNSMTPAQ